MFSYRQWPIRVGERDLQPPERPRVLAEGALGLRVHLHLRADELRVRRILGAGQLALLHVGHVEGLEVVDPVREIKGNEVWMVLVQKLKWRENRNR